MIRTSESIANFCAAFVKAQAEMPGAPKDVKGQVGNQTRFYADLGAVVDASRPVLAKYDLGYVQFPTGFIDGCLLLTTRIFHSSGEWMEGTSAMPISQAQAVGSATTYSKRYSLQGALGIVSEDDDGAAASVAPAQPRAQTRRAAAPAPNPNLATDAQVAKLAAAFRDLGVTDRDEKLDHLARAVKHPVKSSRDLTRQEASDCIDVIERAVKANREREAAEVVA